MDSQVNKTKAPFSDRESKKTFIDNRLNLLIMSRRSNYSIHLESAYSKLKKQFLTYKQRKRINDITTESLGTL